MTSKDILTPGKAHLGFGAMRLPGEDEAKKMVDAYLQSGGNYIDTAYIYTGSEELLKKALVNRHPRDNYMLANKLPGWHVKKPEDRDKIFQESLKRCGVDYFDFYLVHSLFDKDEKFVEEMQLFEYVQDLKKKGLVRHVGFSFHGSATYLDRLLHRHPSVEFVQLQLNYIDVLRGPAGEWHQLAIKHNKPIIVMEPIKGGALAKLPPSAEAMLKTYDPKRSIASWAMQYAGTLENVTCVLSGMSNTAQMTDNIETYKNLKSLTPQECELLENVLVEMSKVSGIACTACKYCHAHCPQEIDIASCFSLYNEVKRGSEKWNREMVYDALGKKAIDCTQCGACTAHCPQQLDIPKELGLVGKEFH